jgi:hypothetical protein
VNGNFLVPQRFIGDQDIEQYLETGIAQIVCHLKESGAADCEKTGQRVLY